MPATFSVSSTIGAESAAVHRDANPGPRRAADDEPPASFAYAERVVAATAPHRNAPASSESGSRS